MKINLFNIGCFKNFVDSQKLGRTLADAGMEVHFGKLEGVADIAIINTCGFIGDAENESLLTIQQYAAFKRSGKIGALWIMGCYSQKVGRRLFSLVPETDRIYGNFDWENIPKDLGLVLSIGMKRLLTAPYHYAYVKISEGCNQPCAYCIKPILNGPLHSISQDNIIRECKWLVSQGVKEIQLVAQNLTAYGLDLYGRKKITELVSRISDIPGIEWIRLHYAYPAGFPKQLLRVICERENVCNYLDMAIQHCSTKMLKIMHRGITKEALLDLIAEIRAQIPQIYLRTTVMTGHPGETTEDFEELYEFVKQQHFERMGVFPYSHQPGSFSFSHYNDDIPESVKRQRALKLIDLQKSIYRQLNDSLLGSEQKVIIDTLTGDVAFARSEHSTPMADPKVHIHNDKNLIPGNFYKVRLTKTLGKDIEGTLL